MIKQSENNAKRRRGRPKGSPNKITASLKDMVMNALAQAGGEKYLAQQAKERPVAFLALLGRVLPLNVTGALEHRYVARIPDVAKSTEEWKQQYAPPIH
jgi:hypothetical protein